MFAEAFNGQVTIPKGQNSNEVSNMKNKKVHSTFHDQLDVAIAKSTEFAKKYHKSNTDENDEIVMN